MRANITVNSAEAYAGACLAGLGIIQAPRVGMERHRAAGSLVRVLEAFQSEPMPASLVHGHAQRVPKRVRAVMSFLAQVLGRLFGGGRPLSPSDLSVRPRRAGSRASL
ncbi:MAG: hypothetical protein RL385_2891 [Pseudomonadota bacterium]|jgi:DNA-binding transcriptional LysR family regulator